MTGHAFTIDAPHPDIENGVPRRPLSYFVTPPEGGMNDETGVILAIEGFGSRPNSEYAIKLRGYLATKYNCLAVTVGYFSQAVKYGGSLAPHPDFFVNLRRHHGITVAATGNADISGLLQSLARILAENGITELDPSCVVIRHAGGEYQSFGLLPAIDHLQVLHEVLGRFPVRRSRLYAFGSSYGGYIALLLGKLAPATFRLIVDNSGFVRAENSLYGDTRFVMQIGPLKVAAWEPVVWSRDPRHPHFFGPAQAMVRDLLVDEHMRPSATRYFCTHYVADTVAPFAEKKSFADKMSRFAPVDLLAVTDGDIDGSLFKEPVHGLRASLRQLFDRSHAAWAAGGGEAAATGTTDFELGSRLVFRCGDRSYVLRYSAAGGVAVAVDRVAGFP